MSHTNSTANYQLPQFLGTDKPAWLTDVNQAFADIDTAMKANEVSAGQANALATQNASAINTQGGQISTLSTKVTALETAQPTDEAQIETNRQNIATNAQNIVEIDNRLGHTSIASIGDGTVTGAIADLDARPSVSDAEDVTYDNTDSGLTATNVQDAIDELAQGAGSNETVKYNSTTDRFEVLYNNSWVQSIRAFVQSIAVWVNGLFGLNVSNGTYKYGNPYTPHAFTIDGTSLKADYISGEDFCYSIVSDDVIDTSNYSAIKIKYKTRGSGTQQLLSCNISGSGNGYLFVEYHGYGGFSQISIGLTTTQSNYATNYIVHNSVDMNMANIDIDEIVVE